MILQKTHLGKILLSGILLFALQTLKGDTLSVLFLGNSHTFWHDVPQLTSDLAMSNGDTLHYEANTPGGCTIGHPQNGHLYNSVSLALIDSLDWDYVILQEHSLFAVIDYYRDTYMYPGAKALDSLIKLNNACTVTIVQVIWGKKFGGEHCIGPNCTIVFEDFEHMQDSLTAEYLRLGDSLSFTLSPAGPAWKQSITNGDPIELFDPDQSHPNLAGSYLAACVHYAVLFQKSPVGIQFTGGLSLSDALYLQEVAEVVVFDDMTLWNINSNKPKAGFTVSQLDNTVICTDTSFNADFYYWDFGDGTTDTVQNPVHTYNDTGTYLITQIVRTSCHTDTAYDTITVNLTGLTDAKEVGQNIKLIPGDVPGTYNLSIGNLKIQDIKVFGIEGILRYNKLVSGTKEYLLNLSHFPAGLYILVIKTDNGTGSYKIVCQ